MGDGASERSNSPPQASSAPSGLSAAAPGQLELAWTARRASASGASTSSALRAATSVGASERSDGPPRASSAPSGGSAVRAATSVGAIYTGRFAPSPTGPLHAGSLVAALASWLDARAHHGQWLVRVEDVDTPRCAPGSAAVILSQLAACALLPDAPPVYQSQRRTAYQAAVQLLADQSLAYPCTCSRQQIALALAGNGQTRHRHGELVYPGTCRDRLAPDQAGSNPAQNPLKKAAWRLKTAFYPSNRPLVTVFIEEFAINLGVSGSFDQDGAMGPDLHWQDRLLGPQHQNVSEAVGDFVLQRADGVATYQLAVVVDDAAQGVTDVVRGKDLADNTARQILLQRALGLHTPRYAHTPLVLGHDGCKLSKQNGAAPLDLAQPLVALQQAGRVLGLQVDGASSSPADWLRQAVPLWANRLLLS